MDIMRVYRQEKALEEQIPHVLQHFHSLFSRFQDMLQYYLGTVADKLKAEGTADDAGAPYATDRVPASMSFKLAIESSWHGEWVLGGESCVCCVCVCVEGGGCVVKDVLRVGGAVVIGVASFASLLQIHVCSFPLQIPVYISPTNTHFPPSKTHVSPPTITTVLALLNLFQQVTVPHVDPLMQAFTAVGAIRGIG